MTDKPSRSVVNAQAGAKPKKAPARKRPVAEALPLVVPVDRLADLRVAHDRLLAELPSADARTLPALVRELRNVLAELEALSPSTKGTALDDLAARRATRLSGTNG